MSDKTKVSYKRHLAKTITWRIIASLTTFGLAFLFFHEDEGALSKAGAVALAESAIIMVLYYFHERMWYKSSFGVTRESKNESK